MQFIVLLCLLLLPALHPAAAQTPTYEPPNLKTVLFGGFSSVGLKPGKDLDRISLNGWTVSATTYRFFPRGGLTAEFGGNANDGNSQQAYLFGGTYRALQKKRFALTGRILAGATRWQPNQLTPGAYLEQTAFTFGFGQSIDIKFSENLALRVQPDLRFLRVKDSTGSSSLTFAQPISIGLVYQFGRR